MSMRVTPPPLSSPATTAYPFQWNHRRETNRDPALVMQKLIECVPNFSEGRDLNVIRQITDAIRSVDGVFLLDVDPGATTNRTVVTFVGDPDAAIEAAFRGTRKA